MSRRIRRIVALAIALALLVAAGASAYYTARGTGSAAANVGTLTTPTISTATPGAATVALTWSAVTAPDAGAVTYYVKRDGAAASAACPSAAAPTSVTSCTDTGVTTAAHSYTVTAVWRSWTGTSAAKPVTVTYGAVTQLVYTTQAAGAVGGAAFTTQPVVTARDAANNTVANYSGTVTLAIKSGTGTSGAALSGCNGTLVNGVTSFTGCKLDKSGTGYQLRATDGTRTVDGTAFNVTAGAVSQLVFTTQPAGAVAGAAFTTQPKVTATDAGGNIVTTYNGTVTLSITSGTGTAGATLDNCTRTLTNGVASFSACEIKKSGAGYQLHASDGTRTADSTAFAVTPGSMVSLSFTTQPAGAVGGTAFTTQPVVTALDSEGNVATGYAGTVTLTIKQPGTSGTLSGCTQARSNGVVTFSGCKIAETGTGYKLRAKDGSPQVDSSSFDVTAGALAHLLVESADTTPEAGVKEKLTITAIDAGGNTVTSYTGSHSITFGGAGIPFSGTAPTVSNSSGTAIAFGSPTALTFSSGVATTSGTNNNGYVTTTKAETVTITATDGLVTDDGSLSLATHATDDTKVAWSNVTISSGVLGASCYFTCTVTGMSNAATFKANVSITDTYGNIVSSVGNGHNVTVSRTAGTGVFTPGNTSFTTLTMSSSGTATTASQFTFTVPSTLNWTTNTLTAAVSGETSATASLSR